MVQTIISSAGRIKWKKINFQEWLIEGFTLYDFSERVIYRAETIRVLSASLSAVNVEVQQPYLNFLADDSGLLYVVSLLQVITIKGTEAFVLSFDVSNYIRLVCTIWRMSCILLAHHPYVVWHSMSAFCISAHLMKKILVSQISTFLMCSMQVTTFFNLQKSD